MPYRLQNSLLSGYRGTILKQTTIFICGLFVLSSLILAVLNFRNRRFPGNRQFIFVCIIMAIEFALITLLNAVPGFQFAPLVSKIVIFLPVVIFSSGLFLAFIFPTGKVSQHRAIIVMLFLLVAADFTLIFINPFTKVSVIAPDLAFTKNLFTIIQASIVIMLLIAIPIVMVARNYRSNFRRLRSSIRAYTAGLAVVYIVFACSYSAGLLLYNLPLLRNPVTPLPLFFILLITNHLVYDIKRDNFTKYYIFIVYSCIFFGMLFFPIVFFLQNYSTITGLPESGFVLKSVIIFIYFLIIYRIMYPIRKFITRWRYQSTLHRINDTLVPVKELNKISEGSSFWRNITTANFQGLKNAIGAEAAYFILFDRKRNGFAYTYGFGPELNPGFIDSGSEVIKCFSAYRTVFEISDLMIDLGLNNIHPDVLKFLDDNGIDISMPFMNMADTIIGFLLIGKRKGGRPYNRDILNALEIYRVKLQSLLITGIILDEVTEEQVSEHDRLVVRTVKKRIIPSELDTIKGIRMGSLYINNSDTGGDYFDSVRLGRDKSAVFMADLSYSGIDSAMMGLQLYSMLHSRPATFSFPEKMLNTMNQVLCTSRITGNYTRCCSVIISSDGNFLYASASFNAMVLYDHDKDAFSSIETAGIPLGIDMHHRYSLTSGRIRENSIAILYSDGLFSSCNSSGETFPVETFHETIRRHWRETPAVLTREIYAAYRIFTGDNTQLNDISLVIIKKVKADD